VLFLGVDVRDSRSRAQSFLAAAGVTYPQVFDPDGSFALHLRLEGVQTRSWSTPPVMSSTAESASSARPTCEKVAKKAGTG